MPKNLYAQTFLSPYLLIRRKAVVDSGGKNEQVVLLYQNSNPTIIGVANVKVAAAFKNETDLLVGVNVLREEDLQLGLVIGQSRSGKFQLVLVRVTAFGAELCQPLICFVVVGVELKSKVKVCDFEIELKDLEGVTYLPVENSRLRLQLLEGEKLRRAEVPL